MDTQREQVVDLLISHSQVLLRSRPYDERSSQWGEGNVEQGAVLHPDYIIFDPLPDEEFGANVHVILADEFEMDEGAQRCIVVPFAITDPNAVEVASAAESFDIELNLTEKNYAVYFEICEGDEVFYKFTLVKADGPVQPRFLIEDEWGGEEDLPLTLGYF